MAVICFDYDGVIADTFALEEMYYLDIYKRRGITLFQTGEDLRNACRGNFYEFCQDHGMSREELDAVFQEYNDILEKNCIKVPLFSGIPELLCRMFQKHTVYVVSLNDAEVIENRLREEDICGFEQIIGWQQAMSKQETLKTLKYRYGDDIYFISDSIGDMKEAVAAEFPHILAVTYGWGDGEDLSAAGAHVLLDTVAELSDYLDKI